jgi:hypothetical protein
VEFQEKAMVSTGRMPRRGAVLSASAPPASPVLALRSLIWINEALPNLDLTRRIS